MPTFADQKIPYSTGQIREALDSFAKDRGLTNRTAAIRLAVEETLERLDYLSSITNSSLRDALDTEPNLF